MPTAAVPLSTRERPPVQRILLAGAAVALLDIAYAYVFYGLILKVVGVQSLFQSIAAGLLGREAYQGGVQTALLGGALHLLIAFAWTLAFYLAVRNVAALRRAMRTRAGTIAVGLAAGAVVYLVMGLVVLELSRASSTPPSDWKFWLNLAQHAVMVGLPMALIIRDGEAR